MFITVVVIYGISFQQTVIIGGYITLNKNHRTHDICFPSFLLCMLENTVLHVLYGGDFIWRFIPTDCHYWCIHH